MTVLASSPTYVLRCSGVNGDGELVCDATVRAELAAVEKRAAELRRGDWMQTASGRQFWPLDPRSYELDICDIAAALSKTCRYGGHTTRFYSVAEHSVHVAAAASDEHQLTALLHDASEAYLVDIPRPVKPHLANYYDLEAALMVTVAQRFGIAWPLPAEVKRLDNAILADERAQVMVATVVPNCEWGATEPALGVTLPCWSPDKAEFEFLAAFTRYGGHYC